MTAKENNLQVRRVGLKHAAAIVDIERDLFPEGQRNGLIKIIGFILNNARFKSDFPIGLFKDSTLVGYQLSYPLGYRKTPYSKHEKMVYLSDFAVIPEYRKYVKDMEVFGLKALRTFYPSRPIITDAFERYKNLWIRQKKFFKEHGFDLSGCDLLEDPRFDQKLYRIRWEPVGIKLHSINDTYRFQIHSHIVHYLYQLFYKAAKRLG